MHCDKFGLKKPIRSGDFKILKFRQCIFAILLSSLEKRFDPSFEQFDSSSTKDALCKVGLKFAN